jgi:ribosomal protein L9
MKVFLRKDIEKVGIAGEIIKVTEGYGRNFLLPQGLGIEVTDLNESQFKKQIKHIEQRKEVIATKTSMLAERIKHISIKLKRKMHDDGKLYGAVNAIEIAEALSKEGVLVSKSQVVFEKSIKTKGSHDVIIKLTSRLQSTVTVTILPE